MAADDRFAASISWSDDDAPASHSAAPASASPGLHSSSKKRKASASPKLEDEEEEFAPAPAPEPETKPGIIYISRIPPGMTPAKVKAIMAQHGEVGRVYLQASPNSHPRRPHYTEGWVEFARRRVAKRVAALLNAQPIGGKKGDKWRDDVWTMKYLGGGFRWGMLSEHVAYEAASHASRLRAELAQSKREQQDYLRRVERARIQSQKAEKAAKKSFTSTSNPSSSSTAASAAKAAGEKGFRQRGVVDKKRKTGAAAGEAEEARGKARGKGKVADVLGSVFG